MTKSEEKLNRAADLLHMLSSRLVVFGSRENEHKVTISGTFHTGNGFAYGVGDDLVQAMRKGIENYIARLEEAVELERMSEELRKEEGRAV